MYGWNEWNCRVFYDFWLVNIRIKCLLRHFFFLYLYLYFFINIFLLLLLLHFIQLNSHCRVYFYREKKNDFFVWMRMWMCVLQVFKYPARSHIFYTSCYCCGCKFISIQIFSLYFCFFFFTIVVVVLFVIKCSYF